MFKKIIIVLLVVLFAGPAFASDQIVKFAWDRSTEVEVVGYQLYRSTSPEGPFVKEGEVIPQVAMGVEPTTSDVVPYVSGTTYYYTLTAQQSDGLESGYSNQVSVKPLKTPILRVVFSVSVTLE